jgi:YhcH/YjgK/YiaL family protein
MLKELNLIMIMTFLLAMVNPSGLKDFSGQDDMKTDKWFGKKEWLNGWNIVPDGSINRKEFAESYNKHRDRWVKAFDFLKNSDLRNLELKRYDIDGDNVYATISEYITKDPGDARYEAHKKYIDIQYVASGKEKIGIAPLSGKGAVIQEYDPVKDVEFMEVTGVREYVANPGRFFIFFPDDIHRPGLKDGDKETVRKVVVKIRIE